MDRKARDIVAEVLRHFISGQITNFDFEDKIPITKDPVIWAIEDCVWCFYDDFTKHKMKGNWALPQESKLQMARWLVFLYSNEEYMWPKISYPGLRPVEYGFLAKLFNKHKAQEIFMGTGDYSVWPFISKATYNNAKQNPVLLAGS